MNKISTQPSKGKFIVIDGCNNVGKSTQVRKLEATLQQAHFPTKTLKYHLYQEYVGDICRRIRHENNPDNYSPFLCQVYASYNKMCYQPQLQQLLNEGYWVIAENYAGTNIARWTVDGVSRALLEELNAPLLKPDLTILLDGERYLEAVEQGHLYENNDEKQRTCRKIFLELAEKYQWEVVNAHQTPDEVHQQIFSLITQTFHLQ